MAQRSPLKAIENNPSKLLKHVKKPGLSPSKYDSIRCLDDEENWRERTEVVTKIQHNIKKEESTHPLTYRVTPEVQLDSDSEYESATEYEEARTDFEVPSPSPTVTGDANPVSPVAHSTLLNTTLSAPNTPERSDMFEDSLLNGLEKMKLEETMTEKMMDVDSSFAATNIKVSQESLSPARCMASSTLDENFSQTVEQVEDHVSDAPIEEKSVEKCESTTTTDEVRTTKISDEDQDFKNSAKSHQLDILNGVDVPNCSPFQTKSAVSNSLGDKLMSRKTGELSEIDVKTENVDVEALSNKIKSEHEENNSVMAPTRNEVCTEEHEEIIVPTKGYNLDFLNAIDDTNFNPFQTKSAVSNSPLNDKHLSMKTEVSVNKEENSVKMENIEACSEMTASTSDESSKISETMDISDEVEVTESSNPVNGCSPLQAKPTVTNSPVKDDPSLPLAVQHLEIDVKTENGDIEAPSNKIKSEHEDNSIMEPMGNDVCIEEQEEIIVPTKGYNLDFLSAIDDTNFDPFQTKSAVSNSPLNDKHLSMKTEVSVYKEENSVKMKNIEACSEMTASTSDESSKISEAMDIADEGEVTESSNPVNGCSPLQAKPTVTNSPVKDDPSLPLAVQQLEIDVKTENGDIEAPSNKIKSEHEDNSIMEPMGNDICIEEQDEIIVPTKGYNLDLLSTIDNTNFNPFQTKSTVLNSPHKQEPDLHTKKDLEIEDPSSKPSCSDIIENVTKTHDLDILNELDSNVNPFETKSLDTNAVKDDAILPSDKLDKTDSAAADVLKRSDDESSKTGVQNSHAENDSVSPGEDDIMGEDQDEFIVSTKSYDLDSLNFLDDENFNPFQTKSAVVNSPVKENIDQAALVNSEEETVIAKSTQNCIEKELDTHINHMEGNGTENAVLKKGLDHCKSKTIQETVNITDKTVFGNESVSDSGTEYFVEGSTVAMEDVPVPGRSYDLNGLDKTDTDFDPFKTRTAVVNSPCRNSQVKKDDTTAIVLQDKAESNDVTENSAKSGHVSESLNELDDPSINPFITKSSVVNSPVKENDITDSNNYGTTNKMEEIEQSSKKDMPSSCQEMNDENVHKSEEKQNMQFVMEERNQELEFKQNVNTKIGLKTGVSFTGEDDQACVNAEDAESRNTETISTSFDFLDNPFETKSTVFNSPKREESSLSKPSTIEEESSKDSGAFTVPNNPKSRDCILKDKDKQFHDNPDVYVSSDLGSARTGDKDLLKEGRDSLGTEKAEETEFKNCADFFSNEEELEMLGKAGGHHKVNSIRDSLFIKFDPLVAKRQSLDVRGSCLMSFSPTLSKPLDKEEVMPPKALVTSVANETLIEMSVMENSVVEDEGNQTVLSTGKAVNLLELSINNQTVRPVYTEQEMNEALKKQELFLQGASLRQYQEFERKLKAVEKQEEQRTIIITGLEEENKELLSDLENMRKLLMESLRNQKARKVEHAKEVEDIKKRLQEEKSMNQETKAQQDLKMKQVQAECDKTESAFFDLVKKYERTQAIVKEQKNNEESMKSCIKDLELKITQMKETFSEILSIHEEKLKQATDYMEETKKAHANEMSKAQVMLKRAEIKIINQKELLERCEKENQRLSAFVDEFTNKFN